MKCRFDCTSKIVSNEIIAQEHLKLKVFCPQIAHHVRPGQFITVKIDSGRLDPLLRRPFSIYKTDSEFLEIVYQVVGRGTEILSKKRAGEGLQILGPLGNGFGIPDKSIFQAILVGGGVGVASLMLLAFELRKKDIDVIALIGANSKERLIGVEDFTMIDVKVSTSTEDGSCGRKGLVTDILRDKLCGNDSQIIYACGPSGMLKAVAKIALSNHTPAQLSFESRMACGVGACLGCVIKIKKDDGSFDYKRVCHDGPVFDAKEVIFDD